MHIYPTISIIISSYNYARYIRQSINSALYQTIAPHEIIVVDDGSDDQSIDYIEAYSERVTTIKKEHGGQASAFNKGFAASSGEWIWFLDADDWLCNKSIEKAIDVIALIKSGEQDVSKIHGPLQAVNEYGDPLNFFMPIKPLSEGNVLEEMMDDGGYCWPPTSGNIFPRWMLTKCMPIPEEDFRLCADTYLCNYAAMFGKIRVINQPLGFYRIHAANNYYGFKMDTIWLEKHMNYMLIRVSLIENLIRRYSNNSLFYYQYTRRSVEMMMIAHRFTKSNLQKKFSRNELHKKWWNSVEIKNITGFSKFKGMILWAILSYAPKTLASYIINMQHKRATRFLKKNIMFLWAIGSSLI